MPTSLERIHYCSFVYGLALVYILVYTTPTPPPPLAFVKNLVSHRPIRLLILEVRLTDSSGIRDGSPISLASRSHIREIKSSLSTVIRLLYLSHGAVFFSRHTKYPRLTFRQTPVTRFKAATPPAAATTNNNAFLERHPTRGQRPPGHRGGSHQHRACDHHEHQERFDELRGDVRRGMGPLRARDQHVLLQPERGPGRRTPISGRQRRPSRSAPVEDHTNVSRAGLLPDRFWILQQGHTVRPRRWILLPGGKLPPWSATIVSR